MLVTIIAAIILLGIVILVHELGHFLAAKSVGIGVPRFSIGLGSPTPLRFRRGETEYVISWIPFGGYVKMATREDDGETAALEGGDAEEFPEEKLFETKPLWARMWVISAGVIMNFVLAWVVYVGIAAGAGRMEDPNTIVDRVHADMLPPRAEDLARIPAGAQILKLNGDTVTSWTSVQQAFLDPRSERLGLEVSGVAEPLMVRIPGLEAMERAAALNALEPYRPPRIAQVVPGRPADRAGLRGGDLIVRIDGDTARSWGQLVAAMTASGGDTVRLTALRDGELVPIAVVPREEEETDRLTRETRSVWRIGAQGWSETRHIRLNPVEAVAEGTRQTLARLGDVLFAVKSLVTGRISPRELGGPIIIGQMSGEAARLGWIYFLSFTAFISINLAVLNLLPIPVLDGGHLVFLMAEGIRGKPLPVNVRMRLTQLGLAFLLALMVFVIFNDVLRIVR